MRNGEQAASFHMYLPCTNTGWRDWIEGLFCDRLYLSNEETTSCTQLHATGIPLVHFRTKRRSSLFCHCSHLETESYAQRGEVRSWRTGRVFCWLCACAQKTSLLLIFQLDRMLSYWLCWWQKNWWTLLDNFDISAILNLWRDFDL